MADQAQFSRGINLNCTSPSISDSAMRAIVGYAFTGPEVRVGKEILFSNQIAKHSTLLGYTYLYRIYPKVNRLTRR